jgi:hypothetical protein
MANRAINRVTTQTILAMISPLAVRPPSPNISDYCLSNCGSQVAGQDCLSTLGDSSGDVVVPLPPCSQVRNQIQGLQLVLPLVKLLDKSRDYLLSGFPRKIW